MWAKKIQNLRSIHVAFQIEKEEVSSQRWQLPPDHWLAENITATSVVISQTSLPVAHAYSPSVTSDYSFVHHFFFLRAVTLKAASYTGLRSHSQESCSLMNLTKHSKETTAPREPRRETLHDAKMKMIKVITDGSEK